MRKEPQIRRDRVREMQALLAEMQSSAAPYAPGADPHAARSSRGARVLLRTRGIVYWPFKNPRRAECT
jgi:hypothetical protein